MPLGCGRMRLPNYMAKKKAMCFLYIIKNINKSKDHRRVAMTKKNKEKQNI